MKRHWILLVVSALLFVVILAPVSAQPSAVGGDPPVVETFELSCNGGSASGSSTAPYVAIFVTSLLYTKPSTQAAAANQYMSMPIKHMIRTTEKPANGIPFGLMVIVPVINGHFSGGMSIPEVPEGTPVVLEVIPVDNLETPYPVGGPWIHFENCKPHVAPHPEVGYELRVIICDTPVYGSPAGEPVSGASVTIGQTFYADPVDTIAADGSHWTQFFDGAWTYPYVPSVCVQ